MPSLEEEDTRKVQTAVFGHTGSDVPVFLPMEANHFEAFIRRFPERAFFCGTLLGGCGNKLSPKQYRDRKCHFAHVSAAARCRRTESDESSADHLYMGRAVADWLKRQRQRNVRPDYKQKGYQVRDLVDVSYDAGHRLIRVQLARRSKREWEAADAELRARYGGLDWFFGPDSLLANWQMDRQGYALRIQCRSVGANREVEIGTQFPDRPVEWTSLSECTLTPEGRIVTPSLLSTPDDIVPRHTQRETTTAAETADAPSPASLPLAPDTVILTDTTPAYVTESHRVYDVSVRITARLVLPTHAELPDSRHAYTPVDAALTLGDDDHWLITAVGVQRTDDAKADPRTGADPTPATHGSPPPHEPLPGDTEIVAAFRETLENTARSRGVVTMGTLCKRAFAPGHELSTERWRDLLVQVEQPRTPGKPIMSSLVKGPDGGPAPFFREVLRGIGWTRHFSEAELLTIWNRERGRIYAAYGRSPTTPPPNREHLRPALQRDEGKAESAVVRRSVTFDGLLDLAREAQWNEDTDSVEYLTYQLEHAARSAEDAQAVSELTDWVVDRRAAELYESWERLSTLADRLDREGDDLHPDQLRRILDLAEELAEQLGTELGADERRTTARWREHLAVLAERPTLSEIQGHATAVRLALRRAVREGLPTTWGELTLRIGTPLAALHPDDKVAVLVEVDRETPEDRPLLSALIASHGGDRPHPLYRQVLYNLDRPVPPPEALLMHWRMALHRHFEGSAT